jgi:ubiquinone/menaquinone biosynthesis C-methylase UbiE
MELQANGHLCPVCLAPVTLSQAVFECTACQLLFPLIDGIPVFAQCKDSAYGIMLPSELEDLLHLCQELGWDKGVAAFLGTKSIPNADSWAAYFSPETRAAGRLLLPANPNARVLDLGCGIGPLSINFARYFDEVVGVDHGLTQLQLLRLRASEAEIRNLRVVCAGDRQHLPFPAESFDVVLLNGVLEWVANMQTGSPRHRQRDFLAEIHRVLKPEGEIYIGIENRFAFTYLSGGTDEHTHLRFVTLLPRKAANLMSVIKSGKPYRVYTYSRRGYRKLLREAGFAAAHFYMPRTNYRKISQIVEGENRSVTAGAFCEKPRLGKMKRWPLKALAYPYLAHSYSIIAGKNRLAPSLIEEAVAELQTCLANGVSGTPKLQPVLVRIGESSVATISVAGKEGMSKFTLRIPLTPQASHQQRHNSQSLSELVARLGPESSLKGLLPEPIATLNCQGQPVFAECSCPGFDLRHCYRPEDQPAVFRLGLDFLLRLHCELDEQRTHSAMAIEAWLRKREAHIYRTTQAFPDERLTNLVDNAIASLRAEPPAVVCTHGDFWPGNLVSTAGGDLLTGVVDWKFANVEGMPLLDLLQLLLCTKGLSSGKGFTRSLTERLLMRQFEDSEKPFVEEYCAEFGISDRSLWDLAFMAWLDWVYRRTDMRDYLPSWREREIDGFLEATPKWVCAAV